jgi:outer membrane receptor protein involved in Fe transport
MRLSYNWNTNRELADFSATDYIKNAAGVPTATSLFVQRIAGVAGGNAFIDATGTNYHTGNGIDPTLLTDAAALAHGGGGRTNYAGIDKSFGYEFQLSPWRSEKLLITMGGNYERADYVNKQWLSFRDGTFIGWNGGGGIKDNGYYYGVWTQAIWTPQKDLTITAGLRYDKQVIQDVYRELGGDQVLYRRLGTGPFTYEQLRFKDVSSKDVTPRVAANWRISDTQNLRAIYAKAFRAVPPQEVIRLPRDFGDAESEQIKDYEVIYNISPSFSTNLTVNAFRQSSNVVYAFNPSLPGSTTGGFTRGSGFTTSGLSADFRWIGIGWEFWSNATYYKLDRASDAFSFMKDYKAPGTPALPNMDKPLDSPTRLFKAGYSRYFDSGTSLSGELHYNGTITSLTPLNLNVNDPNPATPGTPNYLEHEVPSSTTVTVSCRQDFSRWGWKGGFGVLKISNLLDAKVNGVLNMDSQNWNANTYGKPTQLAGFGRQFSLQVGYKF